MYDNNKKWSQWTRAVPWGTALYDRDDISELPLHPSSQVTHLLTVYLTLLAVIGNQSNIFEWRVTTLSTWVHQQDRPIVRLQEVFRWAETCRTVWACLLAVLYLHSAATTLKHDVHIRYTHSHENTKLLITYKHNTVNISILLINRHTFCSQMNYG
jgi:hypothetical protein